LTTMLATGTGNTSLSHTSKMTGRGIPINHTKKIPLEPLAVATNIQEIALREFLNLRAVTIHNRVTDPNLFQENTLNKTEGIHETTKTTREKDILGTGIKIPNFQREIDSGIIEQKARVLWLLKSDRKQDLSSQTTRPQFRHNHSFLATRFHRWTPHQRLLSLMEIQTRQTTCCPFWGRCKLGPFLPNINLQYIFNPTHRQGNTTCNSHLLELPSLGNTPPRFHRTVQLTNLAKTWLYQTRGSQTNLGLKERAFDSLEPRVRIRLTN